MNLENVLTQIIQIDRETMAQTYIDNLFSRLHTLLQNVDEMSPEQRMLFENASSQINQQYPQIHSQYDMLYNTYVPVSLLSSIELPIPFELRFSAPTHYRHVSEVNLDPTYYIHMNRNVELNISCLNDDPYWQSVRNYHSDPDEEQATPTSTYFKVDLREGANTWQVIKSNDDDECKVFEDQLFQLSLYHMGGNVVNSDDENTGLITHSQFMETVSLQLSELGLRECPANGNIEEKTTEPFTSDDEMDVYSCRYEQWYHERFENVEDIYDEDIRNNDPMTESEQTRLEERSAHAVNGGGAMPIRTEAEAMQRPWHIYDYKIVGYTLYIYANELAMLCQQKYEE